ncbi:uncharacterized protein LAESUDRAFT_756339 [Laetiporus sulphureus 93-53]|uniref:Uncharacterized protein n=1 Tax=Laetiporus sulphureus 93-53 TaxID=1314785 RepID=A0A165GCA9_9APHY|nr:uncharacterized protein LAESUDRAFT_756339 [Laetiporus sulphureus 93-53]KZT10150.1 hypothetical protein LAESUDRAFT_756339 [Laetiporus sulphureus 93-53]
MKVDANLILNPIKGLVDYAADADAPLDLDGAQPRHPFLTREPAFINAVKNLQGPGINDCLFLSSVPARSSVIGADQVAMDIIYNNLPHLPADILFILASASPSAPSLFQGVKYVYHSADRSNYNVLSTMLGKAGTPYTCSEGVV